MRDRASGELVGRGGLIHTIVGGGGAVEVGWAVKRERWGEGLATEIGPTARRRPRRAGSTRSSRDAAGQPRSRRVMEKLGLRVDRDVDHRGCAHVLDRGATGSAPRQLGEHRQQRLRA